jgi:ArsR family transcriptional regulator
MDGVTENASTRIFANTIALSASDYSMTTQDSMRQFKAGVFQALAHPTRIFIVETLEQGELTVGKLCEAIGIAQSNASQHLAVLRNKHIVETRKEGNQIFYRLRDPLLGKVLETMRRYFLAHATDAIKVLAQGQSTFPVSEQEGGNEP